MDDSLFVHSWSHSWMVFIMRGFVPCGDDTVFDQVKVGGTEKNLHGISL
jgi:hypothetical protein